MKKIETSALIGLGALGILFGRKMPGVKAVSYTHLHDIVNTVVDADSGSFTVIGSERVVNDLAIDEVTACLLYTSILPDIGMFASFDPVALDQACADACLNAAPLPNSQLGQNLATPGWNCHHDNFKDSNPNIEWKATLEQAEKVGMGTRAYTLKKV